ncbi:glycosyl hydrolase family 43 protein [Colletotrichum asianum]
MKPNFYLLFLVLGFSQGTALHFPSQREDDLANTEELEIVPGATWTDVNTGKHIQAHGAGINKVGRTFYTLGEDKDSTAYFQSVSCYSSQNLVEWKYEGAALSRNDSIPDLKTKRIGGRPKVLYNRKTRNTEDARVGVATADQICGPYEYKGGFHPLGQQSRDIGLYQDDDGSGYLLTEDRPNGLRILKLSYDSLNVTENVHLWEGDNVESPALIHHKGYYFMFGSTLSGWKANDNVGVSLLLPKTSSQQLQLYSYSKSLSGPWSAWEPFAPVGSGTFSSQTTFILPLGNDEFIYMGDRWQSNNLLRSTYVWLPLEIKEINVSLKWRDSWELDAKTESWREAPEYREYEAETALLADGALDRSCIGCSNGTSVTNLGSVAFSGLYARSARKVTIVLTHAVGGAQQRHAAVTCNGKRQIIALLPTASNGTETAGNSTLHCNLSPGKNTVLIARINGVDAPDLDKVHVPRY